MSPFGDYSPFSDARTPKAVHKSIATIDIVILIFFSFKGGWGRGTKRSVQNKNINKIRNVFSRLSVSTSSHRPTNLFTRILNHTGNTKSDLSLLQAWGKRPDRTTSETQRRATGSGHRVKAPPPADSLGDGVGESGWRRRSFAGGGPQKNVFSYRVNQTTFRVGERQPGRWPSARLLRMCRRSREKFMTIFRGKNVFINLVRTGSWPEIRHNQSGYTHAVSDMWKCCNVPQNHQRIL